MSPPGLLIGASSTDRLAFETLISDTSARLMAAPPEVIVGAIEDALEQVRGGGSGHGGATGKLREQRPRVLTARVEG